MTIRDSREHCKWLKHTWFWGSMCVYSPETKYTKDGNSINKIFAEIKRKDDSN